MPTFQKAEFVLKCKNCVKQLTRIVNETSVNIKDIMKVAHLMEEMSLAHTELTRSFYLSSNLET